MKPKKVGYVCLVCGNNAKRVSMYGQNSCVCYNCRYWSHQNDFAIEYSDGSLTYSGKPYRKLNVIVRFLKRLAWKIRPMVP